MRARVSIWTVWLTLAALSCGCSRAIKTTRNVPASARPVVKDATLQVLLEAYNRIARGVQSLTATVELKPTAGSQYSGLIEEYHEVKAFLLAKRPADVRMIGQAPVIGKTVFDMASDGETFSVSVPSKQKFIVGPVRLEKQSKKPIENLRPQHLLDAFLWPEIRKEEQVLFEEFNDERGRYYVLTVVRGGYRTEIARKIWFDRADLQVSRIENFGPHGALLSDVYLSGWETVAAAEPATPSLASDAVLAFPRVIRIERPHDDYRLDLQVTKLALNEEIPADHFKLEQPTGAELVRVGEEAEDKKP